MDRMLSQEKQLSSLKRIESWVTESIDSGMLPKRPDLMLKLLEMTSSIDTHSNDVVNTLAQDEELSTTIIRQARIKLDARVKLITTKQLQQSIQRLGYDFVQSTIEADCVKRFLKHLKPANNLELLNELRHSLRTAFIAKNISRLIGETKHDYAFFAGLMHNMGKIIIGLKDPRMLAEIRNMLSRGMDEKSAELILMGFEHNEVSAKLVEAWELPNIISEVIRFHEHPSLIKEEHRKLANILRLSKYIATALNDKEKTPRNISAKVGEYLRMLGKELDEKATIEEIKDIYIKTLSMEDRVFMQS